jgi:hypothetical protein
MPKYNPKSTAPEQMVATKILEIMQGVPLAEAWNIIKQPKPDIPDSKLGWSAELIRDVLAKRSYDTTLRVVNDALGLLHESGRVSKTVGVFGFDTYELTAAKAPGEV